MRLVKILIAVFILAEIPSYTDLNAAEYSATWRKDLFIGTHEDLTNVPIVSAPETVGGTMTVVVKNSGTTVLEYQATALRRVKLFQETFTDGEWRLAEFDMCGTGADTLELLPGHAVRLEVRYRNPDKRERMSTVFTEKHADRGAIITLATESK